MHKVLCLSEERGRRKSGKKGENSPSQTTGAENSGTWLLLTIKSSI